MSARFVSSNRATRDAASLVGLLIWICFIATSVAAQPIEPSARGGGHVIELARFLESAEIYAGIDYPPLSVFPLRLRDGDGLPGSWLTMDDALASGRLVIFEKGGGGQVPLVQVENRSRMDHVLIMAGELLSGGKQARTVRQDVIVAPASGSMFPCCASRNGVGRATQNSRLAKRCCPRRSTANCGKARIKTGSGPRWPATTRRFAPRTRRIACTRHWAIRRYASVCGSLGNGSCPKFPAIRSASCSFWEAGPRGAEFFGHRTLAIGLLPKLIDSYMVDVIIQGPRRPGIESDRRQQAAIEFFEQIRRGASVYANTPGAGDGIRSRTPELLGEGVGLDRRLVHFGIQPGAMVIPHPRPDSR
jgi:hypothetical protein